MKSLKLILYIPLLILLAVQTSCKKESLTKETQTGANTFSCKINGKVFIPCNDFDLFVTTTPLYVHYDNNFTRVFIGAQCNKEVPYRRIYIDLDNFHGVGEYLLSDVNNSCIYLESDPIDKYYKSQLTKTGKVTITKDDRTNSILSGTFEFTAADKTNPSDMVTVSSGRFDIKTN